MPPATPPARPLSRSAPAALNGNGLSVKAVNQGALKMAVMHSAREIAEAAVEKERKRRNFYAQVAELSTDAEMKDLFRFLTEEEDRHIACFSEIRDSLPRDKHSDEYTADMDAYMDSVIDHRLYAQIDSTEFVRRAIHGKEVFRLAIGFEKDAILYFREFLPFLSEPDQKIVSDLIEQEKAHIRKLVEVRNRLGA
jgi:rubrerythrin